jgi:hypothetical protein
MFCAHGESCRSAKALLCRLIVDKGCMSMLDIIEISSGGIPSQNVWWSNFTLLVHSWTCIEKGISHAAASELKFGSTFDDQATAFTLQ